MSGGKWYALRFTFVVMLTIVANFVLAAATRQRCRPDPHRPVERQGRNLSNLKLLGFLESVSSIGMSRKTRRGDEGHSP